MANLSKKVRELEIKIDNLETKILELSKQTSIKRKSPESRVPFVDQSKVGDTFPSTGTGLGRVYGNQPNVIFNEAEAKCPPWGEQPAEPTKGYNKHNHGRFSGGALDINTLELVEYETHEENVDSLGYPVILDSGGNPVNKQCQAYWKVQPNIKQESGVSKIGLLDIEFDTASKKWVAGAQYIDVEKTYLVQYVWKKDGNEVPEGTEGATKEIKKDDNENEMKSPLLYTLGDTNTVAGRNENLNKSNGYWDKDAQCWRFYSIFKPYPEEEE